MIINHNEKGNEEKENVITEFKTNIIDNYSIDIQNMFLFEDYIIVDNYEEINELINNIFAKEEKITAQINGKFSAKLNGKFLILAKKDELLKIFKKIYKFILIINKNTELFKSFIDLKLKELFSLINLILLFNDNFTFYSLKKKILLKTKKNNENLENNELIIKDIILSEYYFTCLSNKNLRKSSVSWDYKYFLIHNFKENLSSKEINTNEKVLVSLKDELNSINLDKNIFKDLFILKDLEIINTINLKESRNCHMWRYLRQIYNESKYNEKKLILLFSFYSLRKCPFDYSAFSFIINSKDSFPFTKEELIKLVDNLELYSLSNVDNHKSYIKDLRELIL